MLLDPRVYVRLAQEAYLDPPDVSDDPCRAIFRDTSDGLAVIWQGTTDHEQALADVRAALAVWAPTIRCKVPDGFWRCVKYGWEPIFARIKVAKRWVAVGHSLGAAEAILTSALAFACGLKPCAVFAFEPPRTAFGPELAVLYAAMGLEVDLFTRSGNDIVTEVPEWASHPVSLTHIGQASLPIDNLEDHAIARVIESIDAAYS